MQATRAGHQQLDLTFINLQSALSAALLAAGCDPAKPQQVARDLDISRNLTWKVSKALQTDLNAAMKHLPGREGLGILITALEDRRIPTTLVHAAHHAAETYYDAVELHAGDRATLALMLDAQGDRLSEPLEHARRLSFRGNSGVWGVQARARTTTIAVAPNAADPAHVDLALVGGVVDFRRLRHSARWPLFRQHAYDDTGTTQPDRHEPLIPPGDPRHDPDAPMLLRPFCSVPPPQIEIHRTARGTVYEAAEGPQGNQGTFSCYFGTMTRSAAPRYQTRVDKHAELYSEVTLPAESMQFDVFIHKTIPIAGLPEASLRHMQSHSGWAGEHALPISESLVELDTAQGLAPTSHALANYPLLVDTILAQGPWHLADFRAFRFHIAYPPMHSSAVIRFPLQPHP